MRANLLALGKAHWARLLGLLLGLVLVCLAGCSVPQVRAEDRLFLDLSVDYLGATTVPAELPAGVSGENEPVGGLSALSYDVQRDRLYALSDSRTQPRFYTLKLTATPDGLSDIEIERVTPLTDTTGTPLAQFDPEGLALTPRDTLLVASEGTIQGNIPPGLSEFDRQSGQLVATYPIPDRYLPDASPERPQTQGVQENLGFEALATNALLGSSGYTEPYRVFIATEGPLLQDLDTDPEIPFKNRMLHYLLSPDQTVLISEHWYPMDLSPLGAVLNGLSELTLIDRDGHFLALERAFGLQGYSIKLYQLASGGASDTRAIASLRSPLDTDRLRPIRKQLLLDLGDLPLALGNFEGMTLGPQLSDGSRTLLVVSDNNFSDQPTQFLLFRLSGLSS